MYVILLMTDDERFYHVFKRVFHFPRFLRFNFFSSMFYICVFCVIQNSLQLKRFSDDRSERCGRWNAPALTSTTATSGSWCEWDNSDRMHTWRCSKCHRHNETSLCASRASRVHWHHQLNKQMLLNVTYSLILRSVRLSVPWRSCPRL